MAAKDWVEIYESYTPAELDREIADLKKQKSVFVTQQIGSKSFTRDLRMLQDQLQAAVRQKKLLGSSDGDFSGRADFSGA